MSMRPEEIESFEDYEKSIQLEWDELVNERPGLANLPAKSVARMVETTKAYTDEDPEEFRAETEHHIRAGIVFLHGLLGDTIMTWYERYGLGMGDAICKFMDWMSDGVHAQLGDGVDEAEILECVRELEPFLVFGRVIATIAVDNYCDNNEDLYDAGKPIDEETGWLCTMNRLTLLLTCEEMLRDINANPDMRIKIRDAMTRQIDHILFEVMQRDSKTTLH